MEKAEIRQEYEKDQIFFARFLQYFFLPFATPARLLFRNNLGKKYYYGLIGLLSFIVLFLQIGQHGLLLIPSAKNIERFDPTEDVARYFTEIIISIIGVDNLTAFFLYIEPNSKKSWFFDPREPENLHIHVFIYFLIIIAFIVFIALIVSIIKIFRKQKTLCHYGKSWLCYLPYLNQREWVVHSIIEPVIILSLAYKIYPFHDNPAGKAITDQLNRFGITSFNHPYHYLAKVLAIIGIATLILSIAEQALMKWQQSKQVDNLTLKYHIVALWPFLFAFLL